MFIVVGFVVSNVAEAAVAVHFATGVADVAVAVVTVIAVVAVDFATVAAVAVTAGTYCYLCFSLNKSVKLDLKTTIKIWANLRSERLRF